MTSMTTFVRVVDSGGFAAAARKLKMSPSTVTAHVQALEERLGVRLLNRSTRRVSLTEVGKEYYERCLQILAELDEADHVAQAAQSTPRGVLRLNASVTIPPLLAPVIAEYTSLHPDVRFNLVMSDRMVDLVEEGFDLAIRVLPIPDSSLIVRRVGGYRLLVCAAPNYLAAHGVPRRPADLVHHNCLAFAQSPWGSEWRFAGPNGVEPIAVSGNLETNSANALRVAAMRGQGLTLMPSFLVSDEIRSGALVPLLLDYGLPEQPINAIYPHRHRLSVKVSTFLDLVTKHHREDPAWADPCPQRRKSQGGAGERTAAADNLQRPIAPSFASNSAVG